LRFVPPASSFDWQPVWLSLRVALAALIVVAIAGTLTGRFFARRRFRGQGIVESFLLLPLVLPPVVSGFALLLLLGRRGWVGAWLWNRFEVQLLFSPFAAMTASALVSFPLMFYAAKSAFVSLDFELEDAASSLGASPVRVFWTVALPLAAPGLLAGLSLSFARALGEFGATILVAGNIAGQTTTISTAIYMAAEGGDTALAARYCVVLGALNLVFVVLAGWVARGKAPLR